MHTESTGIRGAGQQLLQRELARWWWAPLVAGIAWFLIGWVVLRADYTSVAAVGVLVGVVFVIAAITEGGLAAVVSGGWKALHIALAVVFALGAVWAFVRPVNTFFALASMLGLILFVQGFFYIIQAFALRDSSPYWWIQLVSGGLIVVLALWISTSDRVWNLAARGAFILLWVGFMAVFRGIRDIVMAFELRRLGKEAEVLPPEPEAGAPPFIPAHEARAAGDSQREPQP